MLHRMQWHDYYIVHVNTKIISIMPTNFVTDLLQVFAAFILFYVCRPINCLQCFDFTGETL